MDKKETPPCAFLLIFAGLAGVGFFVCRSLLPSQGGGGAGFSLQDLNVLVIIVGGIAMAIVVFGIFGVVSGWRQARLIHESQEYLARALPIELQKSTVSPIPADLPEAPAQESIHPVCFRIFNANHGLCLALLKGGSKNGWVPGDNASLFRQLSGEFAGRIVIPWGNFRLYYILCRQEAGPEVELAPLNEAGFSGTLPDPLGADQVKMVIVYNAVRAASRPMPHDRTIYREQPLKLKLVVVDKMGQDDPSATCELYNALYKSLQPAEPGEEDESWLYGPRPWWHY
jgi:hypothetical protein